MQKRCPVLFAVFVLFLSACSQATAPTESPSPLPVPTNTFSPPTNTPEPSPTPIPAGPKVVFVSNRGDNPNKTDLYVMDVDSGEVTALNTGLEGATLPKWSPDGSKVLFAIKEVWNLYTIDADGSNLTQLTDFRSNNGDWSPDGSKIVFQSDAQNEPVDTPDIYVVDADGQNLVELVDLPEFADYNPRWAAGSNQIMFLSNRTGLTEVFLMNADGSDVTQVTESGSSIINASISPDGERIAFVYPQGGRNTDLYTIGKSGELSSVVRLTKDATFDDGPTWLPDGSKVVFYSNRAENYDLWMIDADGSNPLQLTNDEYYDSYPDYWAP